KGRQYSVKTFRSLVIVVLLSAVACREKPIDQGALITARTIGLDDLQRGRLAEAEQEFRTVIALAPRDPLGYANLGLTYLRAGRYAEAESQLDRARRLGAKRSDTAPIIGARCSSAFRTTSRSGSNSPMRCCGSVRLTARFATWRKCGGCVPSHPAKQSRTSRRRCKHCGPGDCRMRAPRSIASSESSRSRL